MSEKRETLMVDQRERDTILAALRLWQHFIERPLKFPEFIEPEELLDIADNGRKGDDAALDGDDIDRLIVEHVNV